MLRLEFAKHRRKPLAFYTEDGNPLVWFKDGKLERSVLASSATA
jgi:hypothetical protein